MICPKCGAHGNEGVRFCANCGADLSGLNSNPVQPVKKKLSTTTKIIIGIIAGIIGVAVFAIGGFFALQFITNQGGDVVINSDVVIYDESSSPFKIIASDDESVTLSSMDGISDRTILSAGVSEQTPDGLLRHMGSAEQVNGGYRVSTTPAALTEAIERCNVSYTITLTGAGMYEVRDNNDASSSPLIQQAFAADIPLDNLFSFSEEWVKASAGNAIDVSLKIEENNIEMSLENHFYTGVIFDLNSETSYDEEISLFGDNLLSFAFFVGDLPVVFTNSINSDLVLEAEVSDQALTAQATVDRGAGFRYSSSNGLSAINNNSSSAREIEFKPSGDLFTADFEAELETSLSNLLYGVIGPELSIGLTLEADADLQKIETDEDGNGAIEVPGLDWKLKGALREIITVPVEEIFKAEVSGFNPFESTGASGLEGVELINSEETKTLVDIDVAFGKTESEPPTQTSYLMPFTTPALEGVRSGSDGKPSPTGERGSMPSFCFDYPEGWKVEKIENEETFFSVILRHTSGIGVKFFAKVGEYGGVWGNESWKVLTNTKLDNIAVIRIDAQTGSVVEIRDTSATGPILENVSYNGNAMNFMIIDEGDSTFFAPTTDFDSKTLSEAIAILSSLRLA